MEFMDHDSPCLAFNFDSGAGVFVERLAIPLQGRVHRGHLIDLADKGGQRGLMSSDDTLYGTRFQDRPRHRRYPW
jgi:hypothetical protein